MKEEKKKIPNTLQDQAWKRAKDNPVPRTGYPWDWEDYEKLSGEQNESSRKDDKVRPSKK